VVGRDEKRRDRKRCWAVFEPWLPDLATGSPTKHFYSKSIYIEKSAIE